ncbi:MAG: hypothetical protein ACRBDL_03580 [Alphaproteobacteria bacterium]
MGKEDLSKGIDVDAAFGGTSTNPTTPLIKTKVIIADDHDMVRKAVRLDLENMGIDSANIIEAKDAFELLTQRWFDNKQETAIIISDEQMPPSNLKGSDALGMIAGECAKEGLTPPLMMSHTTLANSGNMEFDQKIAEINAIPVKKGQLLEHTHLITRTLGIKPDDHKPSETPEHE